MKLAPFPVWLAISISSVVSGAGSQAGPDAGQAAPASPKREMPAEVELSGTIRTKTKPKHLMAYVSKEPCHPSRGPEGALGSVRIDPNVSMNFFIEIFVPQGSTGHVCAAAMDAQGKVVELGAHAKNPLTFRGRGEVTFSGLMIDLRP